MVSGSFTEIQCGIRENAKILEGIRDLTPTLVQFWEGPELYYPYSGSVLRQNLGMGCGIGKENDIRDSDGRNSGCGIVVKEERECGIGTPLSPLPPPHPRSRPRFDTDHPTALKRKRVANIKDQLRFNRYNSLAFRGFLLYLADLHVREIPEIRKNLDA